MYIKLHRPSEDVKECANPNGRVGMLDCVLSPLVSIDEDDDKSRVLFPAKACHLLSACGKLMSKSIPYMSSSFGSAGFQISTRGASTFTT